MAGDDGTGDGAVDVDVPSIGAHWRARAAVRRKHEMYTPPELEEGPEGLSFALWQSVGGPALEPGHRVTLVENGHIFDALVEAIGGARESVHLMVYIWRPSRPSDRIVQALLAARGRGVAVRVVVDPVGSESVFGRRDFDRSVEPVLTRAGCQVHYYRLLANHLVGRMLGRTHQKLCVVDGRVGFTGGWGIWKTWEGEGLAEENWRDTSVRLEGPAVRTLQLAFARAWSESGGALLPRDAFPECAPLPASQGASARAAFVASTGMLGVTDADRMYRLCIAAARRRLWISNAYFSPPNAILDQLEQKARGGVDVRVLAPGPVHDQKLVRASQRSLYPRLARAGVRVWEYQPSMLHAKTLVADDWLSVVGSTNLDSLSLNKLVEGSLVVADAGLASQLADSYLRDLGRAREVTAGRLRTPGPVARAARRLNQWAGMDR